MLSEIIEVQTTCFFRKPGAFFSIEEVFATAITAMPASVKVTSVSAPCAGATPSSLLRNCLWAHVSRGKVNHITGDIHYLALGLPKAQTILTIHDLRLIDGAKGVKAALHKLLWFTLPVRRVRYVTVISEETRRVLSRHVEIPSDKVKVIPDCVSPLFSYSPQSFDERCPRILHIGTTDNKNLLRVAEALRGIDCNLKILGEPTTEQVEALRANGIRYAWVSRLTSQEVASLYRECDLVCFASTYEGFGMPIIEANAIGRPVITSNLSSMPEVAGDAALYVDPFDVDSIRTAVLRIMAERALREELIAKGLKNAKRFSPETVATMYADLYRQVQAECSSGESIR